MNSDTTLKRGKSKKKIKIKKVENIAKKHAQSILALDFQTRRRERWRTTLTLHIASGMVLTAQKIMSSTVVSTKDENKTTYTRNQLLKTFKINS